ncbi:MAG: ATP-binding protein [Polyangiaceae bacterium]|nr:ATP-binding protein [Polyangiaceae bacterium]
MKPEALPFDRIPHCTRGHLALLVYEAVHRVIHHLYDRAVAADRELDAVFEEFPFLVSYFRALYEHFPDDLTWDEGERWLRDSIRQWEARGDAWLPMCALEHELDLDRDALLALVTVGLVEEDAEFGTLFASLQQPLGERRPTLGLVHELVDRPTSCDAWTLLQPLVEVGLVKTANPDAPRAEWVLRVPLPLWSAVRGEQSSPPPPGLTYHSPDEFTALGELLLSDEQLARLRELGPLLGDGRVGTVVLRGSPGSERIEVLGAIARSLGRGLFEVEGQDLSALPGPLCTLARAMPVFVRELAPGESFELPRLRGYAGPVGVVLGRDGGVTGAAAGRAITFQLEPDPPARRLLRWRAAFDGQRVEDIQGIADRFLLPARYIRQSAQLAVSYAALEAAEAVSADHVREAVRAVNRQSLDVLATWLPEGARWTQLVVAGETQEALGRLKARCRQREKLSSALGQDFPGGLGRGVRALFEGASGTGKTLAARVLAADLGLDLYRVDLASVVNKYIGETEKNLGRVLSQAEDLDVVLLLDEGDALMGRRTEVRNANDRYANLETDYLLQRLESYTGIVLVTTNAGKEIDTAFRRRMDLAIRFHLPDAEERRQLWQLHLPCNHTANAESIGRLALTYKLTGGQIRNAAVEAALSALEAGAERVGWSHIESAARAEYRKGGDVCPANARRNVDGQKRALASFLDAIT